MTQRDGAWYDRMYNNRALVPEHAAHFAHWSQASAQVRATQRCFQDVAYGRGLNETLDIFSSDTAGEKAPVVVFIHGGYWRSLDKADHSFIAPTFTAQGAHVVRHFVLMQVLRHPSLGTQSHPPTDDTT